MIAETRTPCGGIVNFPLVQWLAVGHMLPNAFFGTFRLSNRRKPCPCSGPPRGSRNGYCS